MDLILFLYCLPTLKLCTIHGIKGYTILGSNLGNQRVMLRPGIDSFDCLKVSWSMQNTLPHVHTCHLSLLGRHMSEDLVQALNCTCVWLILLVATLTSFHNTRSLALIRVFLELILGFLHLLQRTRMNGSSLSRMISFIPLSCPWKNQNHWSSFSQRMYQDNHPRESTV